jgi:hypothetical protein
VGLQRETASAQKAARIIKEFEIKKFAYLFRHPQKIIARAACLKRGIFEFILHNEGEKFMIIFPLLRKPSRRITFSAAKPSKNKDKSFDC